MFNSKHYACMDNFKSIRYDARMVWNIHYWTLPTRFPCSKCLYAAIIHGIYKTDLLHRSNRAVGLSPWYPLVWNKHLISGHIYTMAYHNAYMNDTD